MFVLGKIKILRSVEDIAEMAFLLFACLYWAVILIPADVECDLIERKYWQSGSDLWNLRVYPSFLTLLLDLLGIKDSISGQEKT